MTGDRLRVGDSDREAAVTALGDHYAAGRLTREEFDERAESAWSARTSADLRVLFADLPRPATATQPTAAPRTPVAPVHPHTGHPPTRLGWLPPLLVLMVVLVVLTHAPLFLLLGLVWVVLARGHRRGPWHGPRRHWAGQR